MYEWCPGLTVQYDGIRKLILNNENGQNVKIFANGIELHALPRPTKPSLAMVRWQFRRERVKSTSRKGTSRSALPGRSPDL